MKISSGRELANAIIRRGYIYFLHFRLFSQLGLGFLKRYQPNLFNSMERGKKRSLRNCIDRYEAFSALLPKNKPLSVLDVGCEQGYFVFEMSKRGGICIGVDQDSHKIEIAQALATVHNIPNALFTRIEVNEENIDIFPKVDVVICLSIFHHWVRTFGEHGAKRIMGILSDRADNYFLFDTGQPNEVKKEWARKLSFMVPDPDTWIRNFLTELGFEKVHNLGQFPTSVSDVPRSLYVAIRKPSLC